MWRVGATSRWRRLRSRPPHTALPRAVGGGEPPLSGRLSRTATGNARSIRPEERKNTEGVTPQILDDVTGGPLTSRHQEDDVGCVFARLPAKRLSP